MTPAFLLWLLPGYVIHLFHKTIRSVRNSSGWDFVALSGLYSALLYVACMLTKVGLVHWSPVLVPLEARFIQLVHLPPECGLLPLAWVYALVWGTFVVRRRVFRRLAWRIWPGDPYLEFMRQSMESTRHVILTLKSGKVYVGVLAGATFDVNEAARSVAISVELSGYRKRENHQVVFDKNYIAYGIPSRNRTLLFPYAEIALISPFSYELHEKFVLSGVTLLQPVEGSPAPSGEAAPAESSVHLAH